MFIKKLWILLAMIILTSTYLMGTESGTEITRDVADDLARYKVTNSNNRTDSKSGFKMLNDDNDSFVIYVESDSAGADAWLVADSGSVWLAVPTGQGYTFSVGGASIIHIDNTGITVGAWLGTAVGAAYGGTGATTLTDGGVLLGSGTGAITPMAVLGNGYIIVGDNSTDPVALAAFTSSTGDLKHEAGGLEADVSAYTGLVAITGGATAEVDSKSELEGHIADVANFAEADGDVFTGDHTWTDAFIMGLTAFQFEGQTDDTYQTFFAITDPTVSDKTIAFQNHDGIVVMDASICYDLEGTNLSITNGVLNAAISSGDVSVGAANYLYLWATGNTQNVEVDNWRVSVGATDLVWERYDVDSWVTKETKTP